MEINQHLKNQPEEKNTEAKKVRPVYFTVDLREINHSCLGKTSTIEALIFEDSQEVLVGDKVLINNHGRYELVLMNEELFNKISTDANTQLVGKLKFIALKIDE